MRRKGRWKEVYRIIMSGRERGREVENGIPDI